MLGAIIGDIIGSRWEFGPACSYDFELFTGECDFTDDSICTIAVADALLKGIDFAESLQRWCRRYPNPMGGYGTRFREWIQSVRPEAYGSFGNGAAMRVSPVAWFSPDEFKVRHDARMSAACTHNHPEGIRGAEAVAYAIHDCRGLLEGKERIGREDILYALERTLNWSGYDIDIDLETVRGKFDETCQGTVPVALKIICESTGFEDAVRKAVSLGADADTLGAIVGSIAEAIWGIPEPIKEKAMGYLPEDMLSVLDEFHGRVQGLSPDVEREKRDMEDQKSLMYWNLGLGNMLKSLAGEDAMPQKTRRATALDLPSDANIPPFLRQGSAAVQLRPIPSAPGASSTMELGITISPDAMELLSMGHIPEAMEDHWFMYCDDSHIRYCRSRSGEVWLEAGYHRTADGNFLIDRLRVSRSVSDLGVNGDTPAATLFLYLILAELGREDESGRAWENYLKAWEDTRVICGC